MKRIFPTIVALILAAFAAIGVLRWAKSQNSDLAGPVRKVAYVGAARDINPGSPLTDEMLSTVEVQVPHGDAWQQIQAQLIPLDRKNSILGRVATRMIPAGAPILEPTLRVQEREVGVDWRTRIGLDRRAVSLPVSGVDAVSGLIEVGDRVDIFMTMDFPRPSSRVSAPTATGASAPVMESEQVTTIFSFLQNIEVLAVGTQTERIAMFDPNDPLGSLGTAPRGGGSGNITIALEPDKAQQVIFALANKAKFTIGLRTPEDQAIRESDKMPATTMQTVTESLAGQVKWE